MRYPKMTVPARKRVLIDRFLGYDHRPTPGAGTFYDMENLSGDRAPLLRTRPRRVPAAGLQGCPAEKLLCVGGSGTAVVLDRWGTLWCRGAALPRLLDGTPSFTAKDENNDPVTIPDPESLLPYFTTPGSTSFVYRASSDTWAARTGGAVLPGRSFSPQSLANGMQISVSYTYTLARSDRRRMVFLGAWVCIFPDGKFANTARLGNPGPAMVPLEDYGDIARHNLCEQGGVLFSPCGPDGEPRQAVWSDTAPAEGCWVDTSDETPTLRVWSQSQELWTELPPYVKCCIPGIAKGLRAGDSVKLFCRLMGSQGPEALMADLWDGTRVLAGAWHDPGDANRDEGAEDYVILPGLLDQDYELELTQHDQSYFSVTRELPEMDFVVEAGNRLWGCRCGGGVNELYGSKLGDFRNWAVFEGLSTDSYRVARGHDGPYTGAAVLGGCPLFFREDSLEKIFPSAGGDHGVVTVSLEGIRAGCGDSAVVIRDKLYYKSPGGVCCYNGTLPVRVSAALGELRCEEAVGGAFGSRYYLSLRNVDQEDHLFVLDTETGLWCREDDMNFSSSWADGDRFYLLPYPGADLLCIDPAADSDGVVWWAETGELIPRLARRRYVTRLQVTAKLDPGAELRVCLRYDDGPWLLQGELRGNTLQSVTLSVFARRCQRLRLRLEGVGGMELHSLSWLTEAGSDV